jgi:hypothetical protein
LRKRAFDATAPAHSRNRFSSETRNGLLHLVIDPSDQVLNRVRWTRNVTIPFDTTPVTTIGRSVAELREVRFLNDPIPTLPPGKRYWVVWDPAIELLKDGVPKLYRAEVEYESPDGKALGPEEYVVDLEMYRGQAVAEKGLPELVKAVEDLRKEHAKWTDGAKGLFVKWVDRNVHERRNWRPIKLR